MKINELFSESNSGRGKYAGSGGTFARQRVDPELLNMVAHKSVHDKEAEELRKANKPPKEYTPNDGEQHYVNIYDFKLPISTVEHWGKTRDTEWAFKIASKWLMMPRYPQAVRDEIVDDPEWQDTVLDVLKIGEYYLKLSDTYYRDPEKFSRYHTRYNKPADAPKAYRYDHDYNIKGGKLRAAGVNDPELNAQQTMRNLRMIILKHAERHGFDKTGRRLPPRNW